MQAYIYIVIFANLFFVQCWRQTIYGNETGQLSLQLSNLDIKKQLIYLTSIQEKGYLMNTKEGLKMVPINSKTTPCMATGGPLGEEIYIWKEIVFRSIMTEQGYVLYTVVIHVSIHDKTRFVFTFVKINVNENGPDNDKMQCFMQNLQHIQKLNTKFQLTVFLGYIWSIPKNEPQSYTTYNSSWLLQQYSPMSNAVIIALNLKTTLTMSARQFKYIERYNGRNRDQGYSQIFSDPVETMNNGFHIEIDTA